MTSRMTSRVNPKPSRRSDALPTGTVTFVFTDIEGSTRLASELGPATYGRLLEQHHRLLRTAFAAHGGVERGTQGDSFLVVFRDARSAVAAAVEAQRALAGTSWPADAVVRVRMGLHSGEGIAGGDDYVGIDINRAARIAAAGHGGQVLVSDATRALAELDLPAGVSVRDLGRHRLKDLPAPEHLFELVVEGLPSEFPPLRSAEAAPGNLPVRLTSFIGREAELAELEELLAHNRLLTLTGPGGTGKTSIAVELARRARDRFPDGVWFVALESVTDPELVASAIVTALGIHEAGTRLPAETLHDHLRERALLLVLDNLEQLEGAGTVVGRLLRESEGLTVVATSRSPLRIAAEQEYPMAPLPLPGPWSPDPIEDLSIVETIESIRLFVDRARRTQPGFRLTPENASAVAEICRRVDGLPLGIELAAARVNLMTPSAIAQRLARHLPLPGTAARDLPDRQQTIERAIAWSHDLLAEPDRRLFARLSVFAGGWDLDAAEAVCGQAEELGTDVMDGIARLVEQSLARALTEDRTGDSAIGLGPRFTMLETVREFAADRLSAAGETGELRRRHALHYLGQAEAAAEHLPGREQVAWLARLDLEQANLRAAIQWTIETADAEPGQRFAAAMWRYWQLGGHGSEGLATVESLFAIPGLEETPFRLGALEAFGGLLYWRGLAKRATEVYEEQLALARLLGDKHAEADALFNVASSIGQVGDAEASLRMLDEARGLYQILNDRRGQARVASLGGIATMIAGDPVTGYKIMSDVLAEHRESDDVFYEALTLAALSWGKFALGEFGEVLPYWREAIQINHTIGDVASSTFVMEFTAILAAEAGLWEDAATMRGAFEALTHAYALLPPRSAADLLSRAGYVERIAAALGPDRYEEALARGHGMSLDDAVEYALAMSYRAEAEFTR